MASLSRQLARWIVGLRYENLPPAVVDRAKGVTLHALASILIGSQTAPGRRPDRAGRGTRRRLGAAVGDLHLDDPGLDLPVHTQQAVRERAGVPDGVGDQLRGDDLRLVDDGC